MTKDEDVYPEGTVVRLKKTGEFAIIKQVCYLRPELKKYFMHYLADIEGRGGPFAVYHNDLELEVLP